MRWLLGSILAAAVLWSGYWFVGVSQKRSSYEAWFEARRADGWQADYDAMRVQGFPNRFDTVFGNLALADPGTGLAWEAPQFQLNQLSYVMRHVIAVWPDKQRIATPLQKYDITSHDMRASVVFADMQTRALTRMTMTSDDLIIARADAPGETRLKALTVAAEVQEADPATYRLGIRADGLAPSLPWKALVDPGDVLPTELDAVTADIMVSFDRPWDRTALEDARPQPVTIYLSLAQAKWGQLELAAAGKLEVGTDGVPEGEITLKARNWREIVDMAAASGWLPEGVSGPVTDALALISQLAGSPKTLDIPLTFAGGRIKLGPVPIAAAPVLHFR